jgi:hypothetical protein
MPFVPLNTNNSDLANYNNVNNALRDLNNKKIKNADLSTTPGELGGEWTSWTVVINGFTVGNGTVTGRYTQIGKTIIGNVNVIAGSTSAFGTNMRVVPPVTADARYTGAERFFDVGNVTFLDSGTQVYHGTAYFDSTTASGEMILSVYGVAATYAQRTQTTSTVPFTMAVNDQVTIVFTYEAA